MVWSEMDARVGEVYHKVQNMQTFAGIPYLLVHLINVCPALI